MQGQATLQAFDALVEDARETGRRRHAGEHAAAAARRGPEPRLTLGPFLEQGTRPIARERRVAIPVSMILHGLGAVAIVLVPILLAESFPTATTGVRAFFVEPMTVPAPPPPPPPAPRGAAAPSIAPKAEARPAGFVAPVEVPTEIQPEDSLALGPPGGTPGGVEGGVPGGVVGGIVTGLPEPSAAPPRLEAVRVGGDIRAPRKVVDVPPVYPEVAIRAHVEGIVIIEATVDERGRVRDATVLRGVPTLDEAALEAVRQWVYTPTLLDGVPQPVIMTVTVRFSLRVALR